jgi:hypothetical protein
MKQEQIIKAMEYCAAEGGMCDECPIDKRHKDDCVCMQHLVKLSLYLIRRLKADKEDAVHKTIATVKTMCSRVAYSDMATGHMKESFVIKAQDLDEIEKELTNVYQSKNQRRQ